MTQGYIITLADVAQIPDLFKQGFLIGNHQPRIAFVGRSNVGKSSLINALMQERVARVSATPGKTKAIHFFHWKKTAKIVADLPGYGFAKVAKSEQRTWAHLLEGYFEADTKLEVVVVLFDSRHGPTEQDIEALEFFQSKSIPIQVVMTKFDQLKNQSERALRRNEVLRVLEPYGILKDHIFWVSIKDQKSLEHLRKTFL